MPQMNPKPPKLKKSGLLKTRCEPELQQWYEGLAYIRKTEVADVLRDALRDFQQRATRASASYPVNPQEQYRSQ
jgi:hypothetical protein